MFFLFQRYRDIFASNIHIHLDNTFKFFFIYRCVVFEKQFWKFILKKQQQQNKQTSKTKKKTYSFSDIRYSNYWYKKNHFLLSENTSEISKRRPVVTKRYTGPMLDVAKKWKVGSFLFPGFTACHRCVSNHVVLANQKTPVYKVSLSSQIPKLNTD